MTMQHTPRAATALLVSLAALLCAAPIAGADAAGVSTATNAACSTASDCELNGECTSSGTCQCDRGWTGPTCGLLNLNAEPTIAYGYGGAQPNTSSWGGGPPVLDPATGLYHFFVTELAGHCGMGTWMRMSQIAHTVGPSLTGPFKRSSLAVPTQSHNAYYAYSAHDKMHLLYHIFDGASPESCNPYLKCDDGTTPGASGIRPPSTPWPKPTCPAQGGAHLHYSTSLDGPWTSAGRIKVNTSGMPTSGSSNPAPYIFENGTVLMIGRGKDAGPGPNGTHTALHNIFLHRASSWNATYEWVRGTGVDGALNIGNGKELTEDPTLYKGRRGFHLLLHSAPDISHAWSEDGLVWNWSATDMGPPLVPGGGNNERPRVVVDAQGDLAAVFVSQLVKSGTDAARTAAFTPK